MYRGIIIIVVVATFTGAMMPGRGRGSDPQADRLPPAAEPWFNEDGSTAVAPRSSRGSQGWGSSSGTTSESSDSEVRLTRHRNGHFYADVEVNGATIEFMIDTGATGIAMTEEDARRAGVALNPGGGTYVGEGAGGALTGQMIKLDRVRLGSRSAEDMSAVVIDGAGTNLLGQTFLSKFAEVTVRGDVMTLR